MLKWYAGAALVAVVAGVGGTLIYTQIRLTGDPFAGCRTTSVAGGDAAIGGPFTLVSETGQTVTDRDVITRPSLIYFGYTFCPDVCPLDTVRNAEATDLLQERGYDVQPVFISVDYGRDTPQTMAAYTENLHPDMLGLTGSEDQLRDAARAYAAYFRLHDRTDDYYLVDHSTFTYLMLPETGFAEFYRRDVSAEDMAASVACFLDAI